MLASRATLIGVAASTRIVVLSAQADDNIIFRDDFNGTSLRPEWMIIDEKPDRWKLIEGEYLLIISAQTGNIFYYGQDLGDSYQVEMSARAQLRVNFSASSRTGLTASASNKICLGAVSESTDAVFICLTGQGSDALIFGKIIGEEKSVVTQLLDPVPTEFKLGISRKGAEFEAGYDIGLGWTSLGSQFAIGPFTKVFLSADNDGLVADTGVRIDYVQITKRQ